MTIHATMRVLVVDDNPTNVELIEQVLQNAGYLNVLSTRDPRSVVGLCAAWKPDLVLLDLHMPGQSGFQVMEELGEFMREPELLPVLVVTADSTRDACYRALALGAKDFITKPIDQRELLLRTDNLLQTRVFKTALEDHNEALDRQVRARTIELERSRLESLTLLAAVGEYHDDATYEHTQRVGELAARLAGVLGLPGAFIADIRAAAPLHDIGKVGVSNEILRKPGPLTAAERRLMMRHPEIGAQILSSASAPVFMLATEIARSHHEHWDGGGYPQGLKGDEIPMAGRITAVADVLDALTHTRPYKPAWALREALALISRESGHQFDPQVAEALAELDLVGARANAMSSR